jgi:hypothetical protein
VLNDFGATQWYTFLANFATANVLRLRNGLQRLAVFPEPPEVTGDWPLLRVAVKPGAPRFPGADVQARGAGAAAAEGGGKGAAGAKQAARAGAARAAGSGKGAAGATAGAGAAAAFDGKAAGEASATSSAAEQQVNGTTQGG